MTTCSKIALTLLSCASALMLAGCGKPEHIDLLGVRAGMSLDEVKAAAPAGASLYCLGDGDIMFDQRARLPPSTTLKFCTWSTLGADGTRSVAQLQLGNATSFQQTLAFSYSAAGYTLSSFGIEFPSAAFSGIVTSLTEKMGKPDSAAGFAGLNETVQWDGKDGTLKAGLDVSGAPIALVMLQRPSTPRS
ncbi:MULTISPECIES: hypothetical protein [Caballeronia]|nr:MULTISPECIES: hypothetical protein [Caballeronia]MCE4547983.1 hypothetical protein [Caballeronia sp. PC1]MCE4575725.1 hypothetical protein [Caballeronia sp. CLC5]